MLILGPSPARFDRDTPRLSPERAQVLEAIQSRESPTSVRDISDELSLHGNTARKHLEGLVGRGLIVAVAGVATGKGRPCLLYTSPSPRD